MFKYYVFDNEPFHCFIFGQPLHVLVATKCENMSNCEKKSNTIYIQNKVVPKE